jgi:aryl-alcohol dehydrogenase-like predicted oxidoreductase
VAQSRLTRVVPSSGERIPVVGLGSWQTFDVGGGARERAPLRAVLARFAERGGGMVDSSPMYGRSEAVIGDLSEDLGIRTSLVLATKVWTSGRRSGVDQMERSEQRLRASGIDLMQVHNLLDVDTHLATLAEWKRAARVRYVGITHYVASAFADLERLIARTPLDFVQLNYSLAEREAEARLLPAAADAGVAVIVNRPFEGNLLFSRVSGRPLPDFAAALGCRSWAQIFLKYVLSHPAVTCAIPATARVEHLEDNLDAGSEPFPDAAERRRIAAVFDRQ